MNQLTMTHQSARQQQQQQQQTVSDDKVMDAVADAASEA